MISAMEEIPKMKIRVVTDSASNMKKMEKIDFGLAPLFISTAEKEYLDDDQLNITEFIQDLETYHGKTTTACPSVSAWLDSFEDADHIFCIPISSTLSGSYNSAMIAKEQYEEMNPGKKVYVMDSRSAGPGMRLLAEKIGELVKENLSFDAICNKIEAYKEKKMCLIYCLSSLHNLASNGRVPSAIAKITDLIGIRIIGDVGEDGHVHPVGKARGEKKALSAIFENMKKHGYQGGKVIIDHCINDSAASKLKEIIHEEFQNAQIKIGTTRGLCSFYAEKEGLMIGFERG